MITKTIRFVHKETGHFTALFRVLCFIKLALGLYASRTAPIVSQVIKRSAVMHFGTDAFDLH